MDTVEVKHSEFKERVLADWAVEETAAAWGRYYPLMKEQLAEVTQSLVDLANARPGMQVLDLASGTGQPALPLAHKVGQNGRVIATDISEPMLRVLRENAAAEGVDNVEARVCDAENLPFDDDTFDLVTSRFGVMFFEDVTKALGEMRRVLKPGGRVALLVWGAAVPGTYFGDSVVPFTSRLAEKPDPDGPGPMRFAEPGKLKRLVEQTGFRDTSEQVLSVAANWRGSPEHMLSSMLELAAPFRRVIETLSDDDRMAAVQEVYSNLNPRFDGVYTRTKAPIVLVSGIK